MGDVMAAIVARLGAVAIVTDGGVRDLAGVRERVPGFQMFARGMVVAGGAPSLGDIGLTVEVCGLTIRPGDLLHGDANGLLSIPLEVAGRVAAAAMDIRRQEDERVQAISSPGFEIGQLVSGH
jgi:regulator of RNase E activity RraA